RRETAQRLSARPGRYLAEKPRRTVGCVQAESQPSKDEAHEGRGASGRNCNQTITQSHEAKGYAGSTGKGKPRTHPPIIQRAYGSRKAGDTQCNSGPYRRSDAHFGQMEADLERQ